MWVAIQFFLIILSPPRSKRSAPLGTSKFCHPVVWRYVDRWSMVSKSHWDLLLWQNTLTSVTFISKGGVEWPWRTAGIFSWETCDMGWSCAVVWLAESCFISWISTVECKCFFSIVRVLLMHLLVNACVFVAKLVCRVLFTACYVMFVAESRRSGIKQGELGPVL